MTAACLVRRGSSIHEHPIKLQSPDCSRGVSLFLSSMCGMGRAPAPHVGACQGQAWGALQPHRGRDRREQGTPNPHPSSSSPLWVLRGTTPHKLL